MAYGNRHMLSVVHDLGRDRPEMYTRDGMTDELRYRMSEFATQFLVASRRRSLAEVREAIRTAEEDLVTLREREARYVALLGEDEDR